MERMRHYILLRRIFPQFFFRLTDVYGETLKKLERVEDTQKKRKLVEHITFTL